MTDWLDALVDLRRKRAAGVLVTVIGSKGSAPREPGAKMVVTTEALFGTIGGGHLEFKASEIARELLAEGGAAVPVTRKFALGPSLGQCCGGSVTALFEIIRPANFDIVLFGAGHVGRALVKALSDVPCRISWIDSREDAFPPELADNVATEFSDAPEHDVADAPPGAYYLVMTHSHAIDLRICKAVLDRGDFRYLGLIGSRSKRAKFERRLSSQGVPAAQIERPTCPIGMVGISGKRPAEIAIAVAAELLALRDAAGAEIADGGSMTGQMP